MKCPSIPLMNSHELFDASLNEYINFYSNQLFHSFLPNGKKMFILSFFSGIFDKFLTLKKSSNKINIRNNKIAVNKVVGVPI